MLRFKIIEEKSDWDRYIATFPQYDVYHTYDFHQISYGLGEGVPRLFAVCEANNKPVMCWPALMRQIEGTEHMDLTSVYGYSGPIVNSERVDGNIFQFLFEKLKESGYVSLFARMHPVFLDVFRAHLLGLEVLKKTTVIVEVETNTEIYTKYRQNHKRDIKRAYARGVKTLVDQECSELNKFSEIYLNAMRDLGADAYFMFDMTYLKSLTKIDGSRSFLIFAELEGEKIGGAMFIVTKNIMQYYIGGVVNEFKRLSPLKIILAAAHEWALENGLDYYILGPGEGGVADNLLNFKRGFGGVEYNLAVFKKIIDESLYRRICNQHDIDPSGNSSFPAYRDITEN